MKISIIDQVYLSSNILSFYDRSVGNFSLAIFNKIISVYVVKPPTIFTGPYLAKEGKSWLSQHDASTPHECRSRRLRPST